MEMIGLKFFKGHSGFFVKAELGVVNTYREGKKKKAATYSLFSPAALGLLAFLPVTVSGPIFN